MRNEHSSGPAPIKNRLLASLPAAEFERLRPHLEPVTLRAHEQLVGTNAPFEHVHFLETGMVSVIVSLRDGRTIEAAMIGKEGLVGVLPALGAKRSAGAEANVQIGGTALRIPADILRREVSADHTLHMAIVRYLQALLLQVMQSVACVGHHTLRQRLARWLLMASDCGESNEIALSHEFLAMMLGVQRPGVTLAVGELRDAGLITSGHARVVITDRNDLEAVSCECYATVKAEYQRLLA